MARNRCGSVVPPFSDSGRRVTTRHSNDPPVRRKGRTKRSPSPEGDVKIVFTLAKRHSDADDSHRALTDSSESKKLGTHLASFSVNLILLPDLSDAAIGRSPMTVRNVEADRLCPRRGPRT
eukprot:5549190-Pleurochrysis_carterae.AAC.1